jgi:ppGpp synthetase/RelA/SpoT-type nucleotidyltranferase/KaiC/GvpD/RAD55 family RecA-like ATPase
VEENVMSGSVKRMSNKMLSTQVALYTRLFPRYKLYAETLSVVLEKAVKKYAPLAMVQARPKAIPSFAEKILRKNMYTDPVNEMTDLCGARVITHIPDEVKVVCEFIEKNFVIDWDNSIDVSQRLKPTEFGYRSAHYIVLFKERVFPNKEIPVEIPKEVLGLKAEVQVRTLLEHSWADFNHDMSYKGAFKIPAKWERELAGLAASLESADSTFSRIHAGLQLYASNYGAYMSEQQIKDEINLQKLVLENDPTNVETANKIGKLWLTLGEWQNAIDILSRYVESGYLPLLRDLGVALCKKHKENKQSLEYCEGQKYLETASASPSKDIDALTSLAGTYKETDEAKVRDLHRQAFMIDPTNPYVLGNYLESEIVHRRDISIVSLMDPIIKAAINRSFDQVEVGINMPWAYYDIGKFHLLMNKPYESLEAYAKGVQISLNEWVLDAALKSIERLAIVKGQLLGYDWMSRLLLIGLAAKFPLTASGKAALVQLRNQATADCGAIAKPVFVVAGGCDSENEGKIKEYRGLILNAFQDFKGAIISGGTTSGVSGFVGELQQLYPQAIRTIGYVPKLGEASLVDKRYGEIRYTDGDAYSLTEALQYWTDLLASEICPSEVKLLGVNGGRIAAVEYRIGLALGTNMAIVQGSGMAAAKLLADKTWNTSANLLPLLNDSSTVWAFIQSGTKAFDPETRETLGKAIHENYVIAAMSKKKEDPSSLAWSDLPEYLKESNRQQADHIAEKLNRLSCAIHKVKGHEVATVKFTKSEVEVMAEMEHARWNVERLLDGWKKGASRDVTKKISPYIVPWSELPDEIKEIDRDTVSKIPELLAKVSIEIGMTSRITSGLPGLDRLLLGGIPEKYAVIMTSPSGDETELLIKRFLEAGIGEGEITLYVTSEIVNARELAQRSLSNFYLLVCNSQAELMVRSSPRVFKLKEIDNLTDVGILLTKLLRTIDSSQTGPRRACIDLVSDVLLEHHAVITRKWLNSLLSNLKSKGFTTLVVIDPQMHTQEEVQAVTGIFDGEIKVYERESAKGREKVLRVRKLYNQKYLEEELVLSRESLEL